MELKKIRALSRQLGVRRPKANSIKAPVLGVESPPKIVGIGVGTSPVVADPVLVRIGATRRLHKKGG